MWDSVLNSEQFYVFCHVVFMSYSTTVFKCTSTHREGVKTKNKIVTDMSTNKVFFKEKKI